MNILVVNSGSSSLKYQLINMENEECLARGNCEKIGTVGIGGIITHKTNMNKTFYDNCEFKDHKQAFEKVIELLIDKHYGVISSIQDINSVGHRVVQGGSKFTESVVLTEDKLRSIEEISYLAPLHNPANIMGIKACYNIFKNKVQVAVFDTSFHSTLPQKAYIFGLPYKYYEKYNIRRYGFHGTSHSYVSNECSKLMQKDIKELKIITCHLGNGASITAVDKGKSVDTTMGFTPVDGLLMGTRCGSIDPSIIPYIMEKEGLSVAQIEHVLNKESGYLGISGIASDRRDLIAAKDNENNQAKLAIDIQIYQIKKYIGSYIAAMNGVDAIIFTGGIGENSKDLRQEVCSDMDFLGIKLSESLNDSLSDEDMEISLPDSTVKVFVIHTNEEIVIARETANLCKNC